MTARIDTAFRRKLFELGGDAGLKAWCSLPFIDITEGLSKTPSAMAAQMIDAISAEGFVNAVSRMPFSEYILGIEVLGAPSHNVLLTERTLAFMYVYKGSEPFWFCGGTRLKRSRQCLDLHFFLPNKGGHGGVCFDLESMSVNTIKAISINPLTAEVSKGRGVVTVSAMTSFCLADQAINNSIKHLVEVLPKTSSVVNKKKPWVRNDLPRYILLSEDQTIRHGKPAGGTHAAPRIHQRRGHFATLQHEKYKRNEDGSPRRIWVKPAWVGTREWEFQGNTYKVLPPKHVQVLEEQVSA